MKRSKNFRLAQKKRRLDKYRSIVLRENKSIHFLEPPDKTYKRVSKMTTTPHPNKCQCCCNVRKSKLYSKKEKLTLAERINEMVYREDLRNYLYYLSRI